LGSLQLFPHPLAALRGWDAGRKRRGKEGEEGKGGGRGKIEEGREEKGREIGRNGNFLFQALLKMTDKSHSFLEQNVNFRHEGIIPKLYGAQSAIK